jgi:anaerobic nitric oxide reductase flavorubredoxin
MNPIMIADGIFRLAADVPKSVLFEGIWPIPHGMTMNSYIVRGEKTALIDGVCGWDGVPETFYSQLDALGISMDQIGYAVLNHLEPDHTGWLHTLRRIKPDFEICATEKGIEMAKSFFGITGNLRPVHSGEVIPLGRGKLLRFEETPNVHWPETMVTLEEDTRTLFSGDAFGSFGSTSEEPFDEQISEEKIRFFEEEALRYFANIIASFSVFVERAVKKVRELDYRILAPAHGLVWRKNPERIVELYERFARYMKGPAEPEITLIWGSMYGNTEQAVKYALEGAQREGIKVSSYRVPEDHVSFILASAWKSAGLILGMPTYEYRMFPPLAHVIDDLARKKVLHKKVFRFGSYGWSGGAQRELETLTEKLQWEFIDPLEFRGSPSEEELDLISRRSAELARKVKERFAFARS